MLTAPRRRRDGTEREHRPARLTLLREIKVDSPVHQLWAGTKLLAVAALSITLSYFPSWGSIGLVVALLLATAAMAHIPRGAWPRRGGFGLCWGSAAAWLRWPAICRT